MTNERIKLTYPKQIPWAVLKDNGELVGFDLDACKAASVSKDGNTVAHTQVIVQLLARIDKYVKDFFDDGGEIDSLNIYDALDDLIE